VESFPEERKEPWLRAGTTFKVGGWALTLAGHNVWLRPAGVKCASTQ
jgi:hypothetical protein